MIKFIIALLLFPSICFSYPAPKVSNEITEKDFSDVCWTLEYSGITIYSTFYSDTQYVSNRSSGDYYLLGNNKILIEEKYGNYSSWLLIIIDKNIGSEEDPTYIGKIHFSKKEEDDVWNTDIILKNRCKR